MYLSALGRDIFSNFDSEMGFFQSCHICVILLVGKTDNVNEVLGSYKHGVNISNAWEKEIGRYECMEFVISNQLFSGFEIARRKASDGGSQHAGCMRCRTTPCNIVVLRRVILRSFHGLFQTCGLTGGEANDDAYEKYIMNA